MENKSIFLSAGSYIQLKSVDDLNHNLVVKLPKTLYVMLGHIVQVIRSDKTTFYATIMGKTMELDQSLIDIEKTKKIRKESA